MAPVREEQAPASKPKRGHQRMSTAEQIDLAISMSLKDPSQGGGGGSKMGAITEGGGGDKWLCPMCTYTNPNQADVCEMCGTPKPPESGKKKGKKKQKAKQQNPSEWIAGSRLEVQLDDGSWVPGLVEGTKTSKTLKHWYRFATKRERENN